MSTFHALLVGSYVQNAQSIVLILPRSLGAIDYKGKSDYWYCSQGSLSVYELNTEIGTKIEKGEGHKTNAVYWKGVVIKTWTRPLLCFFQQTSNFGEIFFSCKKIAKFFFCTKDILKGFVETKKVFERLSWGALFYFFIYLCFYFCKNKRKTFLERHKLFSNQNKSVKMGQFSTRRFFS